MIECSIKGRQDLEKCARRKPKRPQTMQHKMLYTPTQSLSKRIVYNKNMEKPTHANTMDGVVLLH